MISELMFYHIPVNDLFWIIFLASPNVEYWLPFPLAGED
jgi:hypothetical protein